MSKVLVTGAGGFIGAEVCKQLLKNKYRVIAVVSPFSKSSRLDDIKNKITITKCNLADEKSVEKIFKKNKPEHVLHLATHGVYTYQQQDVDRIVTDNFLMTVNLLKMSEKYNVKKFINTGSVFEYGSHRGKVKETDVNLSDILNKYSAVKMATTALVNSYSDKLQVITLRPFTTYGPDEDSTRFMKATIKRALNNEPIRIVKGVVRDFIFVEDVANAYIKSLKNNFISGEVLSIASGKKQTLDNVTMIVKKLVKSKSEIIFDEKYVRSKESACFADISKAKKTIKWSPKFTILQGIKKMLYCLQNDN